MLRVVNQPADHEGLLLPQHIQAQVIPHRQSIGLGKLLLYPYATGIPVRQGRALHALGNVHPGHAVIGMDVQGDILPQGGAIHIPGKAALDIRHALGMGDAVQVRLGHAAQVDPEIRQHALLKIGLRREIQHAPRAIQPAVYPGTQGAQQHDGQKLHGVLAHIAPELFPKRRCTAATLLFRRGPYRRRTYHAMSSTRAGWGLTVFSTMVPLRMRITRSPRGAMLALCVMITTVV